MYIRLNVITIDPDSRRPQGILMAARTLADEGDITNEEAEAINSLIAWFNANLPVPPGNTEQWLSHRAVFWFRHNQKNAAILEKAWELAYLLQTHGISVRVWQANQCPGSIVWGDAYQVAVVTRQIKGHEVWTSRPLNDDNVP